MPSGKAAVFGTAILGSDPSAKPVMIKFLKKLLDQKKIYLKIKQLQRTDF